MKHMGENVNQSEFVFVLGDEGCEDAAEGLGILITERDMYVGRDIGPSFETQTRGVRDFIENPERLRVFKREEFAIDDDALGRDIAVEDTSGLMQEEIAHEANEDKGDSHDGAIGQDSIADESDESETGEEEEVSRRQRWRFFVDLPVGEDMIGIDGGCDRHLRLEFISHDIGLTLFGEAIQKLPMRRRLGCLC
jgi:hypothetical protein